MSDFDSFIIHIAQAIGVFALAYGFIALGAKFYEIVQTRKVRQGELIARKTSHNSGKIAALEYVVEQGQSLAGIGISCMTMGEKRTYKDGDITNCIPRPYLAGLDLSEKSRGQKADLGVDLSGANFTNARHLSSADFRAHGYGFILILMMISYFPSVCRRGQKYGFVAQKGLFPRKDPLIVAPPIPAKSTVGIAWAIARFMNIASKAINKTANAKTAITQAQ